MKFTSLALLCLVAGANAFSAPVPKPSVTTNPVAEDISHAVAPPEAPPAATVFSGAGAQPQAPPVNPTVKMTPKAAAPTIPKGKLGENGGTMAKERYHQVGPDDAYGKIGPLRTGPQVDYKQVGPDDAYGKIGPLTTGPQVDYSRVSPDGAYGKIGPLTTGPEIDRTPLSPDGAYGKIGPLRTGPQVDYSRVGPDDAYGKIYAGTSAPGSMGGDLLARRYDRINPNAVYGSATDSLTANQGYQRVGDAATAPSQFTYNGSTEQPSNVAAASPIAQAGSMGGDMLDRRYDRIDVNARYGSATGSLTNNYGYKRVGDASTTSATSEPSKVTYQKIGREPYGQIFRGQDSMKDNAPPGSLGGDMLNRRFDRIDINAAYGSVSERK